jgi:hypothetical protein
MKTSNNPDIQNTIPMEIEYDIGLEKTQNIIVFTDLELTYQNDASTNQKGTFAITRTMNKRQSVLQNFFGFSYSYDFQYPTVYVCEISSASSSGLYYMLVLNRKTLRGRLYRFYPNKKNCIELESRAAVKLKVLSPNSKQLLVEYITKDQCLKKGDHFNLATGQITRRVMMKPVQKISTGVGVNNVVNVNNVGRVFKFISPLIYPQNLSFVRFHSIPTTTTTKHSSIIQRKPMRAYVWQFTFFCGFMLCLVFTLYLLYYHRHHFVLKLIA